MGLIKSINFNSNVKNGLNKLINFNRTVTICLNKQINRFRRPAAGETDRWMSLREMLYLYTFRHVVLFWVVVATAACVRLYLMEMRFSISHESAQEKLQGHSLMVGNFV